MINTIKNIILFFLILLVYLHVYIHFKISSYNEFTELKEINKKSILSAIYYKLPFVFDGTNIIKPFKKDKKDKNKIHIKPYESLPLLEPAVRFFTTDTIYELKKDKKDKDKKDKDKDKKDKDKKDKDIHTNIHCRNFYMVHSGKVTIYCIHPKYTDADTDISNIETSDILRAELYPNSILFVPNYWKVYIKAHEKSVIEKVQYKTILNEVNFFYDKIIGKSSYP